jgi:hypothetical protein
LAVPDDQSRLSAPVLEFGLFMKGRLAERGDICKSKG